MLGARRRKRQWRIGETSRRSDSDMSLVTCHRSLALRLQQLDGVAELGGAFVEFAGDGDFHLALHDLKLRERALGADFLQPFLEEGELGTFRGQLREAGLIEEILDR